MSVPPAPVAAVIPPLTSLSSCAGCAAKIRPDLLAEIVSGLNTLKPKQVLVGLETGDDAAVYQLSPTQAIVQTADFFPPIVDDPFVFGQVAAANALSDVWAMGGTALFALNLVAFPKELPATVLKEILAGGADKAREAGVAIVGGHSVNSPEPKYGLSVTGTVHPKKVLRNVGAKPGDVLVITKPIGTGIATTAVKKGVAPQAMAKSVIETMTALNQKAGAVFASGKFKVNALTDVTGFGLLGHLWGMTRGSKGVEARLELERIPIITEVASLAARGVVPSGTKSNLSAVEKQVRFPAGLPEAVKHVLADAQTNGGLLAAVPAKDAKKAQALLEKAGVASWIVGGFEKGNPGILVQ